MRWRTDLNKVLQSNSILTLYEMKYVSLELQVSQLYSMDYLGKRSGKFSFRKNVFFFFFLCIFWRNVTSNQNWLSFLNEGKYFDYRLQLSVLLEVTFYAKFIVHTPFTHTCMDSHKHKHKHTFYWWIHELDICIWTELWFFFSSTMVHQVYQQKKKKVRCYMNI